MNLPGRVFVQFPDDTCFVRRNSCRVGLPKTGDVNRPAGLSVNNRITTVSVLRFRKSGVTMCRAPLVPQTGEGITYAIHPSSGYSVGRILRVDSENDLCTTIYMS